MLMAINMRVEDKGVPMLLRDEDDDDKRDLILDQYLPYRMAVIAHLMSTGFSKRYSKDFDMTIGEWRVMANLGHLEPQSGHEIGAHSHLDKVQISRAVARLEKKVGYSVKAIRLIAAVTC